MTKKDAGCNMEQPKNTYIIFALRMGAGVQRKSHIYSLGISVKYWKCTKTISFRLHILQYKIYVWKQLSRDGNLCDINALIENGN